MEDEIRTTGPQSRGTGIQPHLSGEFRQRDLPASIRRRIPESARFDQQPVHRRYRMAAVAAGGRVDMTVEQAGTFLSRAGMLACKTPPDFAQALEIVRLVREWFQGIAGSLNMHRQFQGNSSYLQAEAERMTAARAIDALRSLLLIRRRSRRPIPPRQWDRQLYLFSRSFQFLLILNHERPSADSRMLREDMARPEVSRTVGHPTTVIGISRSCAMRVTSIICW